MNRRIKFFFIFLAGMAVVSVFSFFDVFSGVRSANLKEAPKVLPLDISIDADQDGLSDSDESYWNTDFQNKDTDSDGFLDGEEVASGYDPRIPNDHESGDALSKTVYGGPEEVHPNFDLTGNLSDMIANGIFAGDLKPGVDQQKFDNGINALSFSVVDNFYKTQSPPSVTTNIVDDSVKNQTAYIEAIGEIVKNDLLDLPQKINTNADITSQSSFFKTKGEQFKLSRDKIAALDVPNDWLNIHNSILDFLYRSHLNYLYISSYSIDMLRATMALGELSKLQAELPTLLRAIQTKIADNKISIDSSLNEIMNLLYKD